MSSSFGFHPGEDLKQRREMRFQALVNKHETAKHNLGFELTKADPFLNGNVDILDILAFRDKQNRDGLD